MRTRAEQILRFVKGPLVLDVGCAGHVLEPDSPHWLHGAICKQFPGTYGLDSNADLIKELESLGFRNLQWANAESFCLQRRFDTVVAGELVEHVSNPGLFLERAKEHLTPLGRVIITTPYPFSLLYFLYAYVKFPRTCQNLEHTCWFCPQTFYELTQRIGLRVIHSDLIEDYRFDVSSWRYRILVSFIWLFRWVLPKKIRCNTMLFVLESTTPVKFDADLTTLECSAFGSHAQ
jgi:SAM-dependent methyltransferase